MMHERINHFALREFCILNFFFWLCLDGGWIVAVCCSMFPICVHRTYICTLYCLICSFYFIMKDGGGAFWKTTACSKSKCVYFNFSGLTCVQSVFVLILFKKDSSNGTCYILVPFRLFHTAPPSPPHLLQLCVRCSHIGCATYVYCICIGQIEKQEARERER